VPTTITPFTARRAVLWLFFMNGVVLASWVSRLPAVQSQRALNHAALGLALLALASGAVVSMPVAGFLAPRFGSQRLCKIAAVALCLALPCLALAPGRAGFAACLFAFGAANGMLDVSMNAQAIEVERRYARPLMSSFHAAFSAGGLAGAALGAVIAGSGVAVLAHFAAVGLLFGLATFATFAHLLATRLEPEAGQPSLSLSWRPRPLTLALGVVAICVMVGEGAVADWSAIYLRRNLLANESLAAAGYAAFSVSMAAGRLGGDRLALQLGPAWLTRCSGALGAVGLALVLLTDRPVVALVGFGLVGAGFATVVPLVFSAAARIPGVAPEVGLASVTTLGYVGFLAGPPLIGFVAEARSLPFALWLVAAASAIIFLFAPAVAERRPG
jgi:predicted MFS family arabinose efflux permease